MRQHVGAGKMELSILIARITAVIYLSAAAGALINRDQYRRVAEDMFKNAALTYLMGFTAAIVGMIIVNYHNIWVGNWTVLITILGWLALIKGVLIIAVPKLVERFSRMIFNGRLLRWFPYIAALLGFLFGYLGFVH
jgi:hypothetical protein